MQNISFFWCIPTYIRRILSLDSTFLLHPLFPYGRCEFFARYILDKRLPIQRSSSAKGFTYRPAQKFCAFVITSGEG